MTPPKTFRFLVRATCDVCTVWCDRNRRYVRDMRGPRASPLALAAPFEGTPGEAERLVYELSAALMQEQPHVLWAVETVAVTW